MVMAVMAYCGGGAAAAVRRGGITLNHRVTVVTGSAAAQVNRVGMIVTVSTADSATANYDIVTAAVVVVVVLKASVVVDYYAMITADATVVGDAADCTSVAVVVVALIGVARCSNNVMLLLVLCQVLLQDKLVIGFQGN